MHHAHISLESLDERIVPSQYRWNPLPNNGINWNLPDNWDLYDFDRARYDRNPATGTAPGGADTAIFTGTAANADNCRVTSAITVKQVTVEPSYAKTLILSATLTIENTNKEVGGLFDFNSPNATIAGYSSALGLPAHQGSLVIGGGSTFAWKEGQVWCTDITLGRSVSNNQTWVATGRIIGVGGSVHTMTSSSFQVSGVLDWESGNVDVGESVAPSTVWVASEGGFNILPDAGFWGDGQNFVVHNAGLVKSTGSNTLLHGDYRTSGTTRLEAGHLIISGLALQTGTGLFDLQNSSTVTTENLDIEGGSIIGDGTVDGDLNVGGSGGAGCSPGHMNDPLGGAGGGPASLVFTPGTITVTGDYTQFGDGTLSITINASGGFGKLAVSGGAYLAGSLLVYTSTDYKPNVGTKVTFLTSAGLAGDFGTKVVSWSGSWANPAGGSRGVLWKLDHDASTYFLLAILDTASGPPGGGGGGGSGGGS